MAMAKASGVSLAYWCTVLNPQSEVTCLVCLYHVLIQMPQPAIIFFRVSMGFLRQKVGFLAMFFIAKSAFSSLSLSVSDSFKRFVY